MADSKVILLARKLMALVEQGEGGEAINALAMLQKLMAEHNISEAELDEHIEKEYHFDIPMAYNALFVQTCCFVLRVNSIHTEDYVEDNIRHTNIMLLPVQYVEIQSIYDFYRVRLDSEWEDFVGAFVIKNGIFNHDYVSRATMSYADREKMRKLREMADRINKYQYHKQLK